MTTSESPTGSEPENDAAAQAPTSEPPPPDREAAGEMPGRPVQGRKKPPVFPESRIRVTAWADPVLDNLGHDPRSGYVERYWLSILGPSCLLLLRRLAADLERNSEGFELDTVQ